MKRRWAGVSGYLEGDESKLQRALQEILEETGVQRDKLRLLKEGKPIGVPDVERRDVLWVDHPFLFESSTRSLTLNWEHSEYRWIDPEELPKYHTVPNFADALNSVLTFKKLTLPVAVEKKVRQISKDRVKGASQLARDALAVVDEASRLYRGSNVAEFRRYLKYAAYTLMDARPSMAPISNLTRMFLRDLNSTPRHVRTVPGVKKFVTAACRKWLEKSQRAAFEAASTAVSLILDSRVVMTTSHSSTVMETMRLAMQRGCKARVVVLESRPLLEGRRTARELAELGFNVQLATDAAAGSLIRSVDRVLVGADSVLRDGSVVNKIGTYPLALLVREVGVGFYAVCDMFKFNVDSLLGCEVILEEKDPEEVFPTPRSSRISVRNPYFDITPPNLVSAIITEEGSIPPNRVESLMLKLL